MRQGVLLGFLFLLKFDGCLTEETLTEDYTESDYIDNSIDLIPTYVSPTERFLQKLSNPFWSINRTDKEARNIIERFILGLPRPIQNLLLPVERSAKQGFGDILNRFKDNIHAIYPGTLWCGAGSVAKNEEDIGIFKYTDYCCRDHDNCSNNINAGDEKYSLKNNGIFTRSFCDCDETFYKCLKNANSLISQKIGTTYFNLLRPQCFRYDYPITRCNKYARNRLYDNKCIEYDLDLNQNKTWQWFDNPNF
ncbi:phospholipase A2 isoform X2 [Cephus cinctus]|nr:phospholipase A2 isoform X2 [Cephus cinctus]XP_024940847.1 phospholipase A2 isoform X2 [Cephus cinctus]XP_024940848.1 phospholipase A2 isoform X2 [Cephus cinctus]XP_024940849.1 phospholipase A2 isoform X2 [Cephus cinctus]